MERNTVERDSSATCVEAAFWLHLSPMCNTWLQRGSSSSKKNQHWFKIQNYFLPPLLPPQHKLCQTLLASKRLMLKAYQVTPWSRTSYMGRAAVEIAVKV